MILCTMKWIILSLFLIALIHYLYTFLKNMLTVPKIKDLIHKPQEQYNELLKNVVNVPPPPPPAPANNAESETAELYTELQKYMEEMNKGK